MDLNPIEVRASITVDYTNVAGTMSTASGPVTIVSPHDLGVGGLAVRIARLVRVNGRLVSA